MTQGASETGPGAARAAGEREGEAFDRALRERESRARTERLSQFALGGDLDDGLHVESRADDVEIAALRARFRELAEFHDAVVRSAGWRLLQKLRGLMGRAW